jgi:hypothetical protein
MGLIEDLTTGVAQKVNNKGFDYYEERDRSEDIFGNLSAKRFAAKGSTRGSNIEVVDPNQPKLKVTLDLDWTYDRKEYRGIQPPIQENRTDTGKYIFTVTASFLTGMVSSEVSREASTGDTNHDSARTAFNGLLEDVIRPNFRVA